VGLESAELVGPERLHLVKPRLKGEKGLGTQSVYTKTGIVIGWFLFDFNQAAGSKYAQVSAHRRTADRSSRGKFTGPPRTFAEKFHHLTPRGVGQRSERSINIINHCVKY
jgi:hypothetical protein